MPGDGLAMGGRLALMMACAARRATASAGFCALSAMPLTPSIAAFVPFWPSRQGMASCLGLVHKLQYLSQLLLSFSARGLQRPRKH